MDNLAADDERRNNLFQYALEQAQSHAGILALNRDLAYTPFPAAGPRLCGQFNQFWPKLKMATV